jgi:hypothetical protein
MHYYYYYLFIFNYNLVDTRWQQYTTHLVDTRWQQSSTHLVDTRWQQYTTHLVDTRWQQSSTHLHTISTQNTQNGTYVTIKKLPNLESGGSAPSLRVMPLRFPYNWGKITEKAVRVLEKCPDIPMAAVQYTFTHNQYTERNGP